MGEYELNEILIYSIPNSWSKQAYLQVIGFQIPYRREINMFEWIYIVELVYKGVVENPSKKLTEFSDANRSGISSRNIG